MSDTIWIPGIPHAQKRARAKRFGEHARIHQHPDSLDWKATAQQHMAASGSGPIKGPVKLRILAVFPMPRGRWLKRDVRPREWNLGAKDWDNLGKAISDAGNGVLWMDDRQVVDARVQKITGNQNEMPGVLVQVAPVTDEEIPR